MATVTAPDLYRAVSGIFQSMLGVQPHLHALARAHAPLVNQGIAAIVGYAGEREGSVIFSCTTDLAAKLAGLMLMEEPLPQEDDAVDDAMGEIGNMIAGSIKSLVCVGKTEAQLTLPVVVRQGGYHLPHPSSYDRWRLTCTHADGLPFYVEMVSREPLAWGDERPAAGATIFPLGR